MSAGTGRLKIVYLVLCGSRSKCGVWQREEIEHGQAPPVDAVCRNDISRKRSAAVLRIGNRDQGSTLSAALREIAGTLQRRGHCSVLVRGVEQLFGVLLRGEEEDFGLVGIEKTRDEHRPAQAPAGDVVAVAGYRQSGLVVEEGVGIEAFMAV